MTSRRLLKFHHHEILVHFFRTKIHGEKLGASTAFKAPKASKGLKNAGPAENGAQKPSAGKFERHQTGVFFFIADFLSAF